MLPQNGFGFLWEKVRISEGRAETTVFVPESKKIFLVSISTDDVPESDLTPTEWIEWTGVGIRDAARPYELMDVKILAPGKERCINTEYVHHTTFQSVLLFPDMPDLVQFVGEHNAWSPIVGVVACEPRTEVFRGVYCIGYVERDPTKPESAFRVEPETLKFPDDFRSNKDKMIFEGLAKEIALAIEEDKVMKAKGRTQGDTAQVIPVPKKDNDDFAAFTSYGDGANVIKCAVEKPGWTKFKTKVEVEDIEKMAGLVKEKRYHDVLVYKTRREGGKQIFIGWTPYIGSVPIYADSDKTVGTKVDIGQNLNTRIEYNKRQQKFAVETVTSIEKISVCEFSIKENAKQRRTEILLKIKQLNLAEWVPIEAFWRGKKVGYIDHPQFFKILVCERDVLAVEDKEEKVTAIVGHYEGIENDTPGGIRLVLRKIDDNFESAPTVDNTINSAAPEDLEDDAIDDDEDEDEEVTDILPQKEQGFNEGFRSSFKPHPNGGFGSEGGDGFVPQEGFHPAPQQHHQGFAPAQDLRGGNSSGQRGGYERGNGGYRGNSDRSDRGGGSGFGRADNEGGRRGRGDRERVGGGAFGRADNDEGRRDRERGSGGAFGNRGGGRGGHNVEGFGQRGGGAQGKGRGFNSQLDEEWPSQFRGGGYDGGQKGGRNEGTSGGGGSGGAWGEQREPSHQPPPYSEDWPEPELSHGFGMNANAAKNALEMDQGLLVVYSTKSSIFYTRKHQLVAFNGDARLYHLQLGDTGAFERVKAASGEVLPFKVSPGSLKRIDNMFDLKYRYQVHSPNFRELEMRDQAWLTPNRDIFECKQLSDIPISARSLRLIDKSFVDKSRLKVSHFYDVWVRFDEEELSWQFECIDHTTNTYQLEEEDDIDRAKRLNKERAGSSRQDDRHSANSRYEDREGRHYEERRDREEDFERNSRYAGSSAPSRRHADQRSPSVLSTSTAGTATTVTDEVRDLGKKLDQAKRMLKAVWEYKGVQKEVKQANFTLYESIDMEMMGDAEEDNARSVARFNEREMKKELAKVKLILKHMWTNEVREFVHYDNLFLTESVDECVDSIVEEEGKRYD